MKKLLRISIPLFVMIALFAIVLFSKPNSNQPDDKKKTFVKEKTKKHSCCSDEQESDKYSENSIYQLESEWLDQSGKEFKLSSLKGKKVVLSMIFANCTYACPIIVNDMKKLEGGLSKKEKQEIRFVLVSIDPDRDTPEALTTFANRYNLDLSRWTLLTGSKDDIRELAAIFGFRYVKDEKGDYSHSNLINILDRNGEIAYQHEGLNKEMADVNEKINLL